VLCQELRDGRQDGPRWAAAGGLRRRCLGPTRERV